MIFGIGMREIIGLSFVIMWSVITWFIALGLSDYIKSFGVNTLWIGLLAAGLILAIFKFKPFLPMRW